jgi:uncharacterized protein (DUF1330 family)
VAQPHTEEDTMKGYAIAHLRTPTGNDEVYDYLERIQSTMDPFGGRFLVHGPQVDVREGPWPGTIVVLEFPDVEQPGSGTSHRRTRRSCRCARGTSRARPSSWRASRPVTTPRRWPPRCARQAQDDVTGATSGLGTGLRPDRAHPDAYDEAVRRRLRAVTEAELANQ